MMVARAAATARSVEGDAIRKAVEQGGEYQGAGAVYDFAPTQHVGITKNPYFVGQYLGGKPAISQ